MKTKDPQENDNFEMEMPYFSQNQFLNQIFLK